MVKQKLVNNGTSSNTANSMANASEVVSELTMKKILSLIMCT